MMEKQIPIVVAGADLALTTIGRVAIVLYAVILMIVAALLLWKTISAVHWHSMNSVHSRRSVHGANCLQSTTSTTHHHYKSKPEGRRKTD